MADQLNMGGLSLGEQQAPAQARSYIPPHMRSRGGGPAPAAAPAPNPAMNGGLNNSAWAG
jgi:ATP-dependent RNA helicase DDX3X